MNTYSSSPARLSRSRHARRKELGPVTRCDMLDLLDAYSCAIQKFIRNCWEAWPMTIFVPTMFVVAGTVSNGWPPWSVLVPFWFLGGHIVDATLYVFGLAIELSELDPD